MQCTKKGVFIYLAGTVVYCSPLRNVHIYTFGMDVVHLRQRLSVAKTEANRREQKRNVNAHAAKIDQRVKEHHQRNFSLGCGKKVQHFIGNWLKWTSSVICERARVRIVVFSSYRWQRCWGCLIPISLTRSFFHRFFFSLAFYFIQFNRVFRSIAVLLSVVLAHFGFLCYLGTGIHGIQNVY